MPPDLWLFNIINDGWDRTRNAFNTGLIPWPSVLLLLLNKRLILKNLRLFCHLEQRRIVYADVTLACAIFFRCVWYINMILRKLALQPSWGLIVILLMVVFIRFTFLLCLYSRWEYDFETVLSMIISHLEVVVVADDENDNDDISIMIQLFP